jgi:clan AA aspartic protease (TIGR02281 family)
MTSIKYLAIYILICFITSCSSCNEDESNTSNWGASDIGIEDDTLVDEMDENEDIINISYTERYGGTITIPVKINNMALEMIYDTGASSTQITLAEAIYLAEKGSLTEADIKDLQLYRNANGQLFNGLRINLRSVMLGGNTELNDVEAIIVENQKAPLLLGQSVMKYFKKVAIDNENKVVKFYK